MTTGHEQWCFSCKGNFIPPVHFGARYNVHTLLNVINKTYAKLPLKKYHSSDGIQTHLCDILSQTLQIFPLPYQVEKGIIYNKDLTLSKKSSNENLTRFFFHNKKNHIISISFHLPTCCGLGLLYIPLISASFCNYLLAYK